MALRHEQAHQGITHLQVGSAVQLLVHLNDMQTRGIHAIHLK